MLLVILSIINAALWGFCSVLDIVLGEGFILFILHLTLCILWSFIAKQNYDRYL